MILLFVERFCDLIYAFSTTLVESNDGTGNLNTNGPEESAKETETPSKRKIKREKAEQREAEKREASKLEATQKALTYVRKV